MSDPESTDQQPQNQPVAPAEPTVSSEPEATTTAPANQAPAPEDESTIGTGTSMALGCIAGTVVLIGFGLLFLFLSTLI